MPPGANYTAEHVAFVRRVEACATFYDILGVSRDADPESLKVRTASALGAGPCASRYRFLTFFLTQKAYRKASLRVHPDS